MPATSAVGTLHEREVAARSRSTAICAGAIRFQSSSPALQQRQVRAGIGDDAHVEPVDPRRAAPIARVRAYTQPVAAAPRDEAERPVADGRRRAERARARAAPARAARAPATRTAARSVAKSVVDRGRPRAP